jgi:hypothetical protein
MALKKRTTAARIVVLTLVSIAVGTAYLEFAHRYNFGHLVPYGLHVDVLSEEVSIGIPGQKKMYRAELSNFTFWPTKLDACDYVTDAFGPTPSGGDLEGIRALVEALDSPQPN